MTIAKRSFTICIAESASGKDEADPAFWLATRAAKMGPFCPLGISRVGPVRKSSILFLAIQKILYWPLASLFGQDGCILASFFFFLAFLLTSNLGGGGRMFVPPPYKRLQNVAALMSYIFVSFQQITFKLGNFTNLNALFSVVSTDFPFFPCQ